MAPNKEKVHKFLGRPEKGISLEKCLLLFCLFCIDFFSKNTTSGMKNDNPRLI